MPTARSDVPVFFRRQHESPPLQKTLRLGQPPWGTGFLLDGSSGTDGTLPRGTTRNRVGGPKKVQGTARAGRACGVGHRIPGLERHETWGTRFLPCVFKLRTKKTSIVKGGGQECPPHTSHRKGPQDQLSATASGDRLADGLGLCRSSAALRSCWGRSRRGGMPSGTRPRDTFPIATCLVRGDRRTKSASL